MGAGLVNDLPGTTLCELFDDRRQLRWVSGFDFKLSLVIELFGQDLIRCAIVRNNLADSLIVNLHSPAGSLLLKDVENAGYEGFWIL